MLDSVCLQVLLMALSVSSDAELDRVELASQIKNGDQQAFKKFFEAHHQSLFRFLRSKNIERETAEDLIQRAFVYIWEHRSSIQPDKSLRAYLFKIAYTRMLNHLRDTKKFNDAEPVPTRETRLTPQDEVQAAEINRVVEQTIEAMPERRSQVFELCFIQQFTYKEAAGAMDISVKTVENHMGLALKDMRKALQDFI